MTRRFSTPGEALGLGLRICVRGRRFLAGITDDGGPGVRHGGDCRASGAVIAFLMTRTDLPGRGVDRAAAARADLPVPSRPGLRLPWLPWGRSASSQPRGGAGPGSILPGTFIRLAALILVAGLTHAPHVYLYASASLRALPGDLEEAARVTGASPIRVARDVSIPPMIMPALLFAGVLIFSSALRCSVCRSSSAIRRAGSCFPLISTSSPISSACPSYQLMAVVVMVILAIIHSARGRRSAAAAQRPADMPRCAARACAPNLVALALPPGSRWVLIGLWFTGTVLDPDVWAWCCAPSSSQPGSWHQLLLDVVTLDNYRELFDDPNIVRGILNTLGRGHHRRRSSRWPATRPRRCRSTAGSSRWARVVDYLALAAPRHAGRSSPAWPILWIFLFVKPLTPLRQTHVLRLARLYHRLARLWHCGWSRARCCRSRPELEEAGARGRRDRAQGQAADVTLPLVRNGMLAAWLLIFLIFVREYSTGRLSARSRHRGDRLAARSPSGARARSISLPHCPVVNVAHHRARTRRCACAWGSASMPDLVVENLRRPSGRQSRF